MLRSLALEQLWREHMLAQLAVDTGVADRAIFMAIGPRLNRRVQAAFRTYANELIDVDDRDGNRVPFVAITLEHLIDVIGQAGAADLSRLLWHQYADFDRVLIASLVSEGIDDDGNHSSAATTQALLSQNPAEDKDTDPRPATSRRKRIAGKR